MVILPWKTIAVISPRAFSCTVVNRDLAATDADLASTSGKLGKLVIRALLLCSFWWLSRRHPFSVVTNVVKSTVLYRYFVTKAREVCGKAGRAERAGLTVVYILSK